jgi:major membrane immunogen (membrane-anchored lipoprotein)
MAAADALAIIPGAVLRNLADKLYEKRKNAALEVSQGFSIHSSHSSGRGVSPERSRGI